MKHISFLVVAAISGSLIYFILAGTSRLIKSASAEQPPMAQSLEQRLKNLHNRLNEQWEYTLRTQPEFASVIGDKRYNDRLSDFSQSAIDRDIKQTRDFLQKFEAIDPTGFPDQESSPVPAFHATADPLGQPMYFPHPGEGYRSDRSAQTRAPAGHSGVLDLGSTF